MSKSDETTWQKTWKIFKSYPKLEKDTDTEVVIVGGGIAGITLSYLLAKEGKKVILASKGTLSENGETAETTAFITYEIDTRLQDLKKMFGEEEALSVWRSGADAIDEMERIILEESIDCEFMRTPLFLFANTRRGWQGIEEEAKLGQKAGFDIKIFKDSSGLPFPNQGYVMFEKQAIFHPLKYCDGLRQSAEKYGAKFFENTEIKTIENKGGRVVASAAGVKVTADWGAVTTYRPFNKPKELFAKKGMYKSYVVELSIPLGTMPGGLYIDTDNPYHYFRIDRGQSADRMLLGGEDHRKEIKMNPEKNFGALLEYAEKILSGAKYEVATEWAGSILETIDGLPYIGPYSKENPNLSVATGFSGNGITYSIIAGKIIRDYINNSPNNSAKIFRATRPYSFKAFTIKFFDYAEEFFRGAMKNIWRKK